MKKGIFIQMVLLGLSCSLKGQEFSHVVVWQQDGSKTTFAIGQINKLLLSPGRLELDLTSTPYVVNTDTFRKITFQQENTSSVSTLDFSSAITLYPNPVKDKLYLKSACAIETDLSVYSADGRLCLQQADVPSGLDVRALPAGFYLLKVNNQVYKFRKL